MQGTKKKMKTGDKSLEKCDEIEILGKNPNKSKLN